jgi:hypothetical protein
MLAATPSTAKFSAKATQVRVQLYLCYRSLIPKGKEVEQLQQLPCTAVLLDCLLAMICTCRPEFMEIVCMI